MPSEQAKMPMETYLSLLRHGVSPGLHLQAGEIAEYKKKGLMMSFFQWVCRELLVLGILLCVVGSLIYFMVPA